MLPSAIHWQPMFLLLGTDLLGRRRPVITEALIVAMMLAYLGVLALGLVNRELAINVLDGMALSSHDFHWWQTITYQFAHDNPLLAGEDHALWRLLHIGLNLMCLWVFGGAVESRMGRLGFACFALLGGVIAGLAHTLSSPNPVIGASGMVGALAGAFLVIAPACRVKVLVIFLFIRVWMIPALWIIAFWIAMDLAGWAGLTDRGVAHVAHLAAYLWGAITALVLLPTPALQRSDADLPSLIKRWRRRRAWNQTVTSTPADRPPPTRRMQPEFIAQTRLHLRSNQMDEALKAWKSGAAESPDAALPAAEQLLLANSFQARGDREEAADAYSRYLQRYGTTREAIEVRLLLGLLLTRFLGDPERAAPLLRQVLSEAIDDKRRILAETLLREATA